MRLELGSPLIGQADGFHRYPFASPCGPALYLLASGPSLWPLDAVAPHLVSFAEQDDSQADFTGLERLFVDACRVGWGDELEALVSLPTERRTWLRALAASANGQHDMALTLCGALPDGLYRERNIVITAATQSGETTLDSEGLDGSSAAGKVLAHVLGDHQVDRTELRTGAAAMGTWVADLVARREAVSSLGSVLSRPLPLPGVSVMEQFEP